MPPDRIDCRTCEGEGWQYGSRGKKNACSWCEGQRSFTREEAAEFYSDVADQLDREEADKLSEKEIG